MHLVVYLPMAGSLLLGVSARRLAGVLPPRLGTKLLLVVGAAFAVTTSLALGALASTYLGQLPLVATVGGWSAHVLRHDDPVPVPVAQFATVACLVVVGLVTASAVRHAADLAFGARACRRLPASADDVVVLDERAPEAYALAGLGGGRVVVTTGMLRLLRPDERRVLFAHERAHLRHHHHAYRAAASLVTSLCPLLVGLPAAVRHLTERWADEDASDVVGDRRLVAAAVARAAMAASRARRPVPASAIGEGDVPGRVRSLLAPRPRLGAGVAVTLAAALVLAILTAAQIGRDTDGLFDHAGLTVIHAHHLIVHRR
ncbi:MAG: M48 family metalloprotease [Streptosporangiales bacterium]|nr:M48 family metalloprotease [Streptosporangiales bacterium]